MKAVGEGSEVDRQVVLHLKQESHLAKVVPGGYAWLKSHENQNRVSPVFRTGKSKHL